MEVRNWRHFPYLWFERFGPLGAHGDIHVIVLRIAVEFAVAEARIVLAVVVSGRLIVGVFFPKILTIMGNRLECGFTTTVAYD